MRKIIFALRRLNLISARLCPGTSEQILSLLLLFIFYLLKFPLRPT
ncbi:Uncharacterized protein dnm_006620 [Desulfonema magnum]|uniref:Uncharacterized protein n=1 Tax=Desulfonema magnum TaxID=45655 RepID=A0A975BG39_9BACT|nr:Uncharacterized protein dnm_006620 [Desulfonema magnum]